MKINSIQVEKFKNLTKINEDFSKHNGLSLIIGNNGSGKSNFLEFLSEIFYDQYQGNKSKIPFLLKYSTYNGNEIEITNASISKELPKRIVAVYSGEEDRLWKKYYEPIYKKFMGDIINSQALDYPKMMYLNKFYWEIGLVSLLLSNAPDVRQFIESNLGITKINSISFKKIKRDFKHSEVKAFADSLNDNYNIDDLRKQFSDDSYFFTKLYLAFTDKDNKIIERADVGFNDNLSLRDLSEGQKKQLLIKAALEFAGQEDTLFLFDEPDAHIHLENKKAIFSLLDSYKSNRHIIATTHSPTLTRLVEIKESIVCLENGSVVNVENALKAAKYLASEKEIYKLLFTQSNILITEGKTDDKYISKAIELYENEYPNLHYQILRVGGTDDDNIRSLIDAIDLKKDQKIIILVDRDDAGYNVYKKLFPLLQGRTNFKERKDIIIEKYSDEIYFLMIPHKTKADNNGDFLVEDYFNKDKVIELAKNHIDSTFVSDTPCKNFPNVKQTIKNELLPNFSNNCSKADMVGFKVLLDKLQEVSAY